MWSVSKVECFNKCSLQYKLRYINKVTTLDDYEEENPLKCGTMLHEVIEVGEDKAVSNYLNSYPVATDAMYTESLKASILGRKAKTMLPKGEYEHKIIFGDFIGFIDLLVNTHDNHYDIYDFKYCSKSSKERYIADSPQLSAYQYYLEGSEDIIVDHLKYVFVPKIQLERLEGEDEIDYRMRLIDICNKATIDIVEVPYEPKKVGKLVDDKKKMESCTKFEKSMSALCNWCEYIDFCFKGERWMLLPKAERKENVKKSMLRIWLYGESYSGKTYMADKFPMPLLLNTDGNTRETTCPVIEIKDEITMHGKAKQVKMAWEVFKDALDELEKGSEFQTVVVDLIEDVYESCRLYMYDKLNITHESDDNFRAWDKVRLEFLSTIRKLTNLDYNIVLISQEDNSKDIIKKTGDKMSTVKPAMQEKIAKKISGMVDVTARCVHDDKGYKIYFKEDETQFGGGRMEIKEKCIDATFENLMRAVGMTEQPVLVKSVKDAVVTQPIRELEDVTNKESVQSVENTITSDEVVNTLSRKTRRPRNNN